MICITPPDSGSLDNAIMHQTFYCAEPRYVEERAISVGERARKLCSRGNNFMKRGQYPLAAKDFQSVTRLRPYDEAGYIGLAYALMKMGKVETAKYPLDRVLRFYPRSELVHTLYGLYHISVKETNQALESYRKGGPCGRLAEAIYHFLRSQFPTDPQEDGLQESLGILERALKNPEKSSVQYTLRIEDKKRHVLHTTNMVGTYDAMRIFLIKVRSHAGGIDEEDIKNFLKFFPAAGVRGFTAEDIAEYLRQRVIRVHLEVRGDFTQEFRGI